MKTRLRPIVAVVLGLGALTACGAEPKNAFFAMDTIARGGPDEVVPLLKDLGYDGLGGKALDEAMPAALAAQGLKFFNGYYTATFRPGQPIDTDKFRRWFAMLQGHDAALWLAIRAVVRPDGNPFPNSSAEADEFVAADLRPLADAAAENGVRISLYPHTASWLERVEDAIRLAQVVDRANVGVTFNLCHWLKVEGSERDPRPVLRAALPRLHFVTINGADAGDTRAMAWNRLIQPLGSGTYDVAAFVRTVREVGYTGAIGFQGYGIKEDPRAVLARSIAAWREISATAR